MVITLSKIYFHIDVNNAFLSWEAIYRLEVEDFFSIVTYDTLGNDLFEQGINKYKG
jgi:tartrate dehydratase beta subunit/fumarate hydratase class I family protein